MKIALFIPCLVNQMMPEVAIATLTLLEKLGHEVFFPAGQTCCGQPMTNSGCFDEAKNTTLKLLNAFKGVECDAIVCPAASCLVAAKENFHEFDGSKEAQDVINKLYELTEFLHDVAPIKSFKRPVAAKISLQMSCHGIRMLNLATPTEEMGKQRFNKVEAVLGNIAGLEIVYPARIDECCGFGGTFAVDEGAVSAKMGKDKAQAHAATGAKYAVGFDPSCLLHLDGMIRRQQLPIETRHIAQIINDAL
ncbi:(Fe-S)-binding protein [Shewanella sp. SR43-4]|jgi:L-lactate dehydrogenase complex protein LldE|uniref:(Fe-S)-binding protein n=1 Tax=Shewanella vesiculosa TaxID=518738 RepID=A0ABV0FQ11_9GAMM|nr:MULTISPECIES: (Fe-S)-binding protein [Shewanella]NCQ43801.1 (Fe-S)-binding protein [Shewanella frigidimarina]MBB1317012.1 (Fe-S)-binding protein [Shewanella sp. SR43-4]MBB1321891.1 (Fe-S)-binding protein [Shewanella sp. SR43-8]MBB1389697.1 (Fe-S)-binding protein [Shewanella sp. SG44-6]NCO70175.1 (Fe-S)-binding protein [Shewanella vesiculosa]|tara:strand:+ start:4670 stop:5416 length:747 start_codon:yes stop_codon:yes gene_type:complete